MFEIMYRISVYAWLTLYIAEKIWFDRNDLEWFRTFFLGYAAIYALAKVIEMA